MVDSRFFKKSRNFTIQELADLTGAEIESSSKEQTLIQNIASLDQAGPDDISFLDNVKYRNMLESTKAGACFVADKNLKLVPEGTIALITPYPYKSYALTAKAFYPEAPPNPDISKLAIIENNVSIGEGCTIEAGAIIKSGAEIGENCWIESGAIIHSNVILGSHCRIGALANLSHCILGHHVRLYTGVKIGQDGFGFAIDPAGHVKVPQLGRVIIHDGCEIGANTTIDRGAGPDTVIGQGTWIDNLVQIGHNVKIGRGCIIVSQTGISGSTELGDFVALGGQSGLAGHLKIGSGARIAAQSGVMRDVPAGQEQMGTPSVPIKQFMRQVAKLGQLVKK